MNKSYGLRTVRSNKMSIPNVCHLYPLGMHAINPSPPKPLSRYINPPMALVDSTRLLEPTIERWQYTRIIVEENARNFVASKSLPCLATTSNPFQSNPIETGPEWLQRQKPPQPPPPPSTSRHSTGTERCG